MEVILGVLAMPFLVWLIWWLPDEESDGEYTYDEEYDYD